MHFSSAILDFLYWTTRQNVFVFRRRRRRRAGRAGEMKRHSLSPRSCRRTNERRRKGRFLYVCKIYR